MAWITDFMLQVHSGNVHWSNIVLFAMKLEQEKKLIMINTLTTTIILHVCICTLSSRAILECLYARHLVEREKNSYDTMHPVTYTLNVAISLTCLKVENMV